MARSAHSSDGPADRPANRRWRIARRAAALVFGAAVVVATVVELVGQDARELAGILWHVLWPVGIVVVLLLASIVLGLRVLALQDRLSNAAGTPKASAATSAAPFASLPVQQDSFVGRKAERRRLRELLEAPGSLTTITGSGGVGKTRLAAELGAEYRKKLPGGAFLVPLEEVTTSTDVAARVAGQLELGAQLPSDQPAEESVANMLAIREELLLVLDNFEHVRPTAPGTLGLWAAMAPKVRFLVTSREPLGLGGEQLLRLEPLEMPRRDADPATLVADPPDSVKLFADRAGQARPDFVLDETNVAVVAEICRAVEGLPLAIEMAAANLRNDGDLDQVATGVRDAVRYLRSSRQDVHSRHGSLAAVVDWSVEPMPPTRRRALLQLSVCRGAFSVAAVTRIVEGVPDAQAFLDELLDKSLLRRATVVRGTGRYSMYVAVREYCEDLRQAEETPEARAGLRRRFADHYIEQAETCDSLLDTGQIGEALDRLEADLENVLVAHEQCLADGDSVRAARAFVNLCGTLRYRRAAEDRVSRLNRCLAGLYAAGDLPLAVRTQVELCVAHYDHEDYDAAWQPITRAVEEAGRLEPSQVAGDAHLWKARIASRRGADDQATVASELDAADQIYREIMDDRRRARVCRERADFLMAQEQSPEQARLVFGHLDEGEQLLEGLDAPSTRVLLLFSREFVLRGLGKVGEALECLDKLDAIIRGFAGSYFEPFVLERRAHLQVKLSQPAEAAATYHQLAEEYRRIGQRRREAWARLGEGNALMQSADFKHNATRANSCLAEAELVYRQLQDRPLEAVTKSNRAHIRYRLKQYQEAFDLAEQAMAMQSAEEWRRDPLADFVCRAILAEPAARLSLADAEPMAVAACSRYESLAAEVRKDPEVRWHVNELHELTRSGLLPEQTLSAAMRPDGAASAAGTGGA
jgi:predicted ATPase